MSYVIEELQMRLNTISEERKKEIDELSSKELSPSQIRELTVAERRYYIRVKYKDKDDTIEEELEYDKIKMIRLKKN